MTRMLSRCLALIMALLLALSCMSVLAEGEKVTITRAYVILSIVLKNLLRSRVLNIPLRILAFRDRY